MHLERNLVLFQQNTSKSKISLSEQLKHSLVLCYFSFLAIFILDNLNVSIA